jgi:hypothetical protein
MAMVPVAPGTFSMMSGWASDTRIRSVMMRATVSVGPPGANPTMTVIGPDGSACALVAPSAAASAAASTILISHLASRTHALRALHR